MRIRMFLAAAAVVACFTMMPQVSDAGGRVVTYYGSPFAYVGPAPVYAMPAPVTTAYYQPAITSYYAPAVVPVPGVVPVYYQPAPVVVQPVTTYYAPPVATYYAPRRVVYKNKRPGLFHPYYRSVVKYK
ncbi:MAG: hypothetical protein K0U86_10440 [Planctomycetes bacterium]|nr:hypothetical protein [Planctomycetota bacterium]MCH9725309.1 hypothetical protein [Planctomycetota bacterium]MCH9779471.1 hypothetical protein [Planctomycetota bacterium]MCH9792750.1 hypothetical protein [Planctomycetota bacterium]MDF1742434.1 hypothetical protein [Gimesia sp.]